MTSKDDLCKRIFQELADDGCIVSSQFIEFSSKCNLFQAIHNGIQYDPKTNGLNEDFIRFCLLHEESHNKHPYRPFLLWIISILPFLTIFIVLVFGNPILFCKLIIPLVILFIWLTIMILRAEEYNCDNFAARVLRCKYQISYPSIILKDTFKELDKLQKKDLFCRIMRRIVHPSDKNRVAKIKTIDKYD